MCSRGITDCRIELESDFVERPRKTIRCAEVFTIEAVTNTKGFLVRNKLERIALQEGYTPEEYATWLSKLDFNFDHTDYPEGTIWYTSGESIESEYNAEGSIWRVNYNEEIPKDLRATNARRLELARERPELIKNVDTSFILELLITKRYEKRDSAYFYYLLEHGSYELCVQMIM